MAEYRRTASTDSENEEISVALSQISSTKSKRTRKSTIKPSGKRLPSAPRTIPLDSDDEEELGPNDSGNEQEEEMLFIPGINLPTEFEYSVCASETAESEVISDDSELSSARIRKDNEKLRAALAAKGREVNRLLEKQKEIIAEQVANENMNSVKLKELEEGLNEKLDRDIVSRDKEINKLKKLNEKLQKETTEKTRIIKDLKDKIKESEVKNKENTDPQKGVKTVPKKAVPAPAKPAVVSSVASPETRKECENVQNQRPHRLAVQRKNPNEYSEDKKPKPPMVSVEYLPCLVTTCKELFPNEKVRSVHMKAKHKIKQQEGVICDYCQKCFRNKYGLSGHMKVHKSLKRKADDAFSSTEQAMKNSNNKTSKSS